MVPAEIIRKKRDGSELTDREIRTFIDGVTDGSIAEYQVTAFLMAVYFRGMSLAETVSLTLAMLESGQRYSFKDVPGIKVDKHSTGGVGDKVSLILGPLVAACGVKVPMMAGRGLAHSGGTIDKLESIPGYHVERSESEVRESLKKVGVCIFGQSGKVAPADKKLYALRDVTATVECIPLIVGSILSKKLAEGTDALVIDLKVGNGAFMKTKAQARSLAQQLVRVGSKLGLSVRALITDMSQPLGYSVGNSLEMIESLEILSRRKFLTADGELLSSDLLELTLNLASHMLVAARKGKNLAEARVLAREKLENGEAYKVFLAMCEAQGATSEFLRAPFETLVPKDLARHVVKARKKGFVNEFDTEAVGMVSLELGGGRMKASDTVDHRVGLLSHKNLGAKVSSGEPLSTVYARKDQNLKVIEERLDRAVTIGVSRKPVPKLVIDTLVK